MVKYGYPDGDRLILLKQQVSGKAALLLEGYHADSQTYDAAKNILKLALASTEMQKFNIKANIAMHIPGHSIHLLNTETI